MFWCRFDLASSDNFSEILSEYSMTFYIVSSTNISRDDNTDVFFFFFNDLQYFGTNNYYCNFKWQIIKIHFPVYSPCLSTHSTPAQSRHLRINCQNHVIPRIRNNTHVVIQYYTCSFRTIHFDDNNNNNNKIYSSPFSKRYYYYYYYWCGFRMNSVFEVLRAYWQAL